MSIEIKPDDEFCSGLREMMAEQRRSRITPYPDGNPNAHLNAQQAQQRGLGDAFIGQRHDDPHYISPERERIEELHREVSRHKNRADLLAEDIEAFHMCLDDMGVHRAEDGRTLSMWGRVSRLLDKANAARDQALGTRDVLVRWIAEALPALDVADALEDFEEGGEHLRMLKDRGQKLVDALVTPNV